MCKKIALSDAQRAALVACTEILTRLLDKTLKENDHPNRDPYDFSVVGWLHDIHTSDISLRTEELIHTVLVLFRLHGEEYALYEMECLVKWVSLELMGGMWEVARVRGKHPNDRRTGSYYPVWMPIENARGYEMTTHGVIDSLS